MKPLNSLAFPIRVLFMLLAVNLASCNVEKDSVLAIVPEEPPAITLPTKETGSGIYLEDISRNVPEGSFTRIEVLSRVQVVNNEQVYLKSVTPIGDNVDAQCRDVLISEGGFSVSANLPGTCAYQYEVARKSSAGTAKMSGVTSATATAYVAIQPQSVSLPSTPTLLTPLAVTLQEGHSLEIIDVKTMLSTSFPTGATIGSTTTVLGSGSAIVETSTHEISFSGGLKGITRILYSLTGTGATDTGVIYLGTIDIAVSTDINHAPIFTHFEFEKAVDGFFGIKEGEEVTIDIAPYVSDVDVGDTLQIVQLGVFNAIATPFSTTSTTNTKFTFKAYVSGTYHVAVIVSDHNGGYVVGLVKVVVKGRFPYIIVGEDVFSPTYSIEEASYLNLDYVNIIRGDGSKSPNDELLPLFSYNIAKAICEAKGGYLPNLWQWGDFKAQEEQILWINNDESKQKWPVIKSYFSSDINSSGVIMITFSNTGGPATYSRVNSDTAEGLVACIDLTPVNLSIFNDVVVVNSTEPLSIQFTTMSGFTDTYKRPLLWSLDNTQKMQLVTVAEKPYITGVVEGEDYIYAESPDGKFDLSKSLYIVEDMLNSPGSPDPTFDVTNPDVNGSCRNGARSDMDWTWVLSENPAGAALDTYPRFNCDTPTLTSHTYIRNYLAGANTTFLYAPAQTKNYSNTGYDIIKDVTYRITFWARVAMYPTLEGNPFLLTTTNRFGLIPTFFVRISGTDESGTYLDVVDFNSSEHLRVPANRHIPTILRLGDVKTSNCHSMSAVFSLVDLCEISIINGASFPNKDSEWSQFQATFKLNENINNFRIEMSSFGAFRQGTSQQYSGSPSQYDGILDFDDFVLYEVPAGLL
ncbi:hypothetical protein A9Q75_14380 [Colwellia psychrerythraea]|uniref:Lipoprotein n=1 Tax=Colwellia psychrerythraea TaxID=28229 RepID=A0A1Y5E686_COLPS|nr:hypothetical protein A9Q75_14380 [Colwellia psychrerythraea]